MPLTAVLTCIVALFALAVAAAFNPRARWSHALVYSASALACAAGLGAALTGLAQGVPQSLTLPIGLPWIGAHFRLDALSTSFLAIVDLGGLAASVFAMGYGRTEKAPERVVPFFPAFLAA